MQKWNIKLLNDLYNKYNKLSAETEDPTLSLEYESTANSVLSVIDRYHELCRRIPTIDLSILFPIDYEEIREDDYSILQKYGYYCPYIRNLADYDDLLDIRARIDLSNERTDVKKIVGVSQEFYRQFEGPIHDKFRLLKRRFNDTLHFSRIFTNTVAVGQTFSIYKTNLTFFEIGYNHTVQDYISAIHEFSHGISCSINPDAIFDYNKYCFIEVDSLFFELLGIDYVGEVLNKRRDAFNTNIHILEDYICSAQLISTKLDMYAELGPKDLRNERTMKRYLSGDVGLDQNKIKNTLRTRIKDIIHYIISYLTAVELYLVYQSTPELAINLLLKIVKHTEDDSTKYLEYIKGLGLEPGKNFDKYIQILLEKAQVLKDEKSLRYRY